MEEDQDLEDVKQMTDFINKQKSTYENNFQLEFQDFINYKLDCNDQDLDDEFFDEEDDPNHTVYIKSCYTEKTSDQELIFTEEEQHVIQSCTDPELKRLLILNRSKNVQLRKLHKKIQEYLIELEEEMEEKRITLNNLESKNYNQQSFVWKLAAPYFKDKKFYPCPLNEDALEKRSRNELSVYDLVPSPKWTPIEFDRLINAIKCNYNINRQNDIMSKIKSLNFKNQNEPIEDKRTVEEIVALKSELEKLKKEETVPPLNSNEFISWYKVSETFLKDKHTALECQSVWHMLIHPQINKSEWTEEENRRLEIIAKKYSFQNWNEIAKELDTKRTGFTACLHFFSKLCDKFKKSKFTPEEDKFLLEVVDSYKVGNFIPWNKVVCHFTDRSRHQLYHRYTYFLSQNHVKRGKFSEAEDILLIILVNRFGRNFKKCAEYMPHRSQIQLKSRYNSNLQRHIKKGTFTSEDDQIIYDFVQKHGEKSWSSISMQINRCGAQIRQRYKLIKTFLQNNPNATVADIPKRRHRFDEINEGQYSFVNYMAEQYKHVTFIPTLSMIEETLQVEKGTSHVPDYLQEKMPNTSGPSETNLKNIDTMLTVFFSSSMKMRQCQVITETNLNEASENAEEILKLLGASIEIPEELECNGHFDNIDLEILERISKRNKYSNQSHINKLIPPNISTLVGLRSLIIKHKEYKSQQKDNNVAGPSKCDKLTWPLEENQIKPSESLKDASCHKDQFSNRFDALFHWSAILSLEKPNQFDIPEQNESPKKSSPKPNRLYTKRPNIENNVAVKKRKINVTDLRNLNHHPQLKLVDKNVVEALLKKKSNINVIRIESVQGSDGVIKPLFTQKHSISQASSSQLANSDSDICNLSSHSSINSNVDDRDLQDVESLNGMLQTIKSEVNHDISDYMTEEYESIEDDVRLLKESLKREKVRVKPDPDL